MQGELSLFVSFMKKFPAEFASLEPVPRPAAVRVSKPGHERVEPFINKLGNAYGSQCHQCKCKEEADCASDNTEYDSHASPFLIHGIA